MANSEMIENKTFDELKIGDFVTFKHQLSRKDIERFVAPLEDKDAIYVDENYAESYWLQGIWSGQLLSTILATELPGPGTVYLGQNLNFHARATLGDRISAHVSVKEKQAKTGVVLFDCVCRNEQGETLVDGIVSVKAPQKKITVPRLEMPWHPMGERDHFEATISKCRCLKALKVAVVHPVQSNVIDAVAEAVEEKLIDPILVGPKKRIEEAISQSNTSIKQWTIVNTEHSHAAATKAAEMAVAGEVDALMKGSLHTEELLEAVVPSAAGLRTQRRISHVYMMNIPTYHKPLMISDAAINIAPDLDQKADICRNAIDAWHILFDPTGDHKPKVAILSATEEVTSRIPSTLDAAALCKMSDRGQIKGGELDGPLAFDNAIDQHAVKDKHIISNVAGDADILIVPNIEAGNALAKQMIFLGNADAAGIVLGARVPIILTSRADSKRTRLFSCGVAMALSQAHNPGDLT